MAQSVLKKRILKAALMLSFFIAGAAACRADTINWPAYADWQPLVSQGAYIPDPESDTGNNGHEHLDYVGDATYAAGYLLYRAAADTPGETEDQLLLRMRLNSTKKKMSGAYQVFFEINGDNSVDCVLQLSTDDLDSSGILEFSVAGGTNINNVSFGSIAWTGNYLGNVNWTGTATGDGSNFDGNPDYFLDLSMPWAVFTENTGITSINDPFRLLITSSQNAGQLSNGDIGNALATANTDLGFAAAFTDAIPEPASVALILIAGTALLASRRFTGR